MCLWEQVKLIQISTALQWIWCENNTFLFFDWQRCEWKPQQNRVSLKLQAYYTLDKSQATEKSPGTSLGLQHTPSLFSLSVAYSSKLCLQSHVKLKPIRGATQNSWNYTNSWSEGLIQSLSDPNWCQYFAFKKSNATVSDGFFLECLERYS